MALRMLTAPPPLRALVNGSNGSTGFRMQVMEEIACQQAMEERGERQSKGGRVRLERERS